MMRSITFKSFLKERSKAPTMTFRPVEKDRHKQENVPPPTRGESQGELQAGIGSGADQHSGTLCSCLICVSQKLCIVNTVTPTEP